MKAEARDRSKKIVLTALFSALIAVGAFIRIPVPLLPFTLQFFFVNAAALILGKKWGTLSVVIYIALGLLGLPIFTKGGGLFYVFEPSFGYLLGFLSGTFFAGLFLERVDRTKYKNLVAAGLIDSICVYGLGLPYFYLISTFYLNNAVSVETILIACFLTTVWSDMIFVFFTAFAVQKLDRVLKRNPAGSPRRSLRARQDDGIGKTPGVPAAKDENAEKTSNTVSEATIETSVREDIAFESADRSSREAEKDLE